MNSDIAKGWSVEIDSISQDGWAAALNQFDDGNFYQTWAYGEVSWGRKQLSHFILKRDGHVRAMAQLRIVQFPILKCGIAYVRWGPLWRNKNFAEDPAVLERALEELKREYVDHRRLMLRIIPNSFRQDDHGERTASIFENSGLRVSKSSRPYKTIVVDIRSELENVRKNLDQKWRNQLNRAEKNGIEVLTGTDTRLYALFKQIYEEMMERKAFDTSVDIHEFEKIQENLAESQKMLTLVALKDNKPVSALVGTSIGETGIYLLGATSNEGMKHKGSYLLQWQFIQCLKNKGCKFYDLGGINPEKNPGVYHFKSGFGGKEMEQLEQMQINGGWISTLAVKSAEKIRGMAALMKENRLRKLLPKTEEIRVNAGAQEA